MTKHFFDERPNSECAVCRVESVHVKHIQCIYIYVYIELYASVAYYIIVYNSIMYS
jgi:hypothetical protein